MDRTLLINMVEKAAKFRKEASIPRDYISHALEEIENGKIEVERYPTGNPSLKAVYDIASRMYAESVSGNAVH